MAPRKKRLDDKHQLDLFADSQDVCDRNAVVQSLLKRDVLGAGSAIKRLAAALPTDSMLVHGATLHAHLVTPVKAIPDHASAASELARLTDTVFPAAEQLFGASSALKWIRSDWRGLAGRISGLEFDRRWPEVHSAALLCALSLWEEGLATALQVPNWRRLESPLLWVAQCRFHLEGLETAWPLLAELSWLAPARFAHLAPELPAPGLHRLQGAFEREFHSTVTGYVWFPAWSLIAYPDLHRVLASASGADSAPERCFRTVLDLLILERKGLQSEMLQKRKELHEQSPELFCFFMSARG